MPRRKRGPRAYARVRGPFRNYYGRRPGPVFGEPRISVSLAGEGRSAGRLPSFETAEILRARAARNAPISRRLFSAVHDRNLDVLNLRHAVAQGDKRAYKPGRARVVRRRVRALAVAKRRASRAEGIYARVVRRHKPARKGASVPSMPAIFAPFKRRRRERADRRQLAAGRSSVWQGIDTTLGELRAPARVRRAPVTTPFLPGVVQRAARESARPSRKRKASSPMAAKKAVTKKAATRAVKAAVHKPAVKAEIKKVARAEVKKVVRRRRVGVYRQYSAPIGPMPRGPRGGHPRHVRLAAKAITPVRARRRYPRRRKAS